MGKIIDGVLLYISLTAIFLSFMNALWAFFLSISVTDSKNFVLVSILMVLFYMILPISLLILKREKFQFSFYPSLMGIIFGLANVIFLSILNYSNSAVIYAMISPTILIFILFDFILNRNYLNSSSKKTIFIGGTIIAIGFLILSFSGITNYIISVYDIIISLILLFLYGFGGFLQVEVGIRTKNIVGSMLNIGLFEMLPMFLFLPFVNTPFDFSGLIFAALAGIVLSFGLYIGFYGLNVIQKSIKKMKYSFIFYILSESETVILTIIYEIFVRRLAFDTIFSILLIALAIWYVSAKM